MAQLAGLPKNYRLDETDPGVVVLLRDDGPFVAAFIPRGATKGGSHTAAPGAARGAAGVGRLGDDATFVAAFITRGATKEGILQAAREAAREDQAALIKQ